MTPRKRRRLADLVRPWQPPERFRDRQHRPTGVAHVGAARVRWAWLSTPLALLWVDDDHLRFRSRLLAPRPIRFPRGEVRRVLVEPAADVAWAKVHVETVGVTGLRFVFASRQTRTLVQDLRQHDWPVEVP